MREGTCSAFVSSLLLCVIIVRIDSTMTTRLTDPMLQCGVSGSTLRRIPLYAQETWAVTVSWYQGYKAEDSP